MVFQMLYYSIPFGPLLFKLFYSLYWSSHFIKLLLQFNVNDETQGKIGIHIHFSSELANSLLELIWPYLFIDIQHEQRSQMQDMGRTCSNLNFVGRTIKQKWFSLATALNHRALNFLSQWVAVTLIIKGHVERFSINFSLNSILNLNFCLTPLSCWL
jgi:hypothetical protein